MAKGSRRIIRKENSISKKRRTKSSNTSSSNVSSTSNLEHIHVPCTTSRESVGHFFVTLCPGLEFIAKEEICERLCPSAIKCSDKTGYVIFSTSRPIHEVVKLRSSEGVFAFVAEINGIPSDMNGLDYLQKIAFSEVDWEPAIALWKAFIRSGASLCSPRCSNNFSGNLEDTMTTIGNDWTTTSPISFLKSSTSTFPSSNDGALEGNDSLAKGSSASSIDSVSKQQTRNTEFSPRFRVTGRRTGHQHYRSPQIAGAIGAGLIDRYNWKVDLTRFDLEVLADLHQDHLLLGIALYPSVSIVSPISSPSSLTENTANSTHPKPPLPSASLASSKDNDKTFRNPLNQTGSFVHGRLLQQNMQKWSLAYCMVRLARIQPGQCILDPMTGEGIIPIVAAETWKNSYFIGGDISTEAVEKAVANVFKANVIVELIHWNAFKIPLASKSVDISITDIPNGKRIGSYKKSVHLYTRLFRELTRIVKPRGKAILLTQEKSLMNGILDNNIYWQLTKLYPIECNGLLLGLYVLERSDFSL